MDAVFHMSQGAFLATMYTSIIGMGATVVLLLAFLFREIKNHTLW